MESKKFWMVAIASIDSISDRGHRSKFYETKDEAITCAKKVVEAGKTEHCYIMEAVLIIRTPPIPIEVIEL